jgi:hypothetical protein
MPGLQADVNCGTEPFEPLDGADVAQGYDDERILGDLRRLIIEGTLTGEQRRIGVLDTAAGGDSCRKMAKFLRVLNEATPEPWAIRFHLIHGDEGYPSRSTGSYGFQSGRLSISLKYDPSRTC